MVFGSKLIQINPNLWMWQRYLDPLFKTHYTASMKLQTLLFLSTVCYVCLLFCFRALSLYGRYSGSAIKVYGTYIRPNGSGILGPNVTWECFIDDFSNPDARISLHAAPLLSQNNWGLCSGQFGGGNHTLTVIATLPDDGPGNFFYVDQIQYMPSADAQLNKSLMRIDSSDAEVKYSFGWYWISQPASLIQYSGNTHYTFTNGTWFTLDFSGS